MTGNKKNKGGRPTDFYPELGEQILELMTEGLSLTAAAAELNIHRQRVYEWKDRYPQFADDIKLSQGKRQLFLERRLLNPDATSSIITSTIFALKNASPDDWREKQEITGANGGALKFERIEHVIIDVKATDTESI